MEFVSNGRRHSGTVKDLFTQLSLISPAKENSEYWPRSPRGLGDALRRIAPAMRQIGIHVAVEAKPRRDGVHCELRLADVSSPPHPVNEETSSQRSPTFTAKPNPRPGSPK